MRPIIFALICTSLPLVSGLSAAPSSHAADSDDASLYGVEMPKVQDTAKPALKVAPNAVDTSVAKPKASTPDTTSKKTAKHHHAVKDSTALKKKMAAAAADTSKVKTARMDSAQTAPKKDTTAAAKIAPQDTVSRVSVDSTKPPAQALVKPPDTTASKPAVADTGVRKPRPRLVRETTINAINEMKGQYRSPKKALFMSLVVPGLGQAYIGQTTSNYVRAAVYFSTDVVLASFWYQYVVVKYNREVRHYQHFADQHWNQLAYENQVAQQSADSNKFLLSNPSREIYCADVIQPGDFANLNACNGLTGSGYAENYSTADSNHAFRVAYFPSLQQFYDLIGQEQEFISGWDDVKNFSFADTVITGSSAELDQYIGMRATANRYSRMQAWFIGGIVLNHIASALDAALTATYHNRQLYESESMWYERLHFNGGLAFAQGWPQTNFIASISF